MPDFKVAVAQTSVFKGDVNKNIHCHLLAIDKAAKVGVKYIVFPELSLTGYEPELALQLAFEVNDLRLKPLIDAAIRLQIYVVVGLPLLESNNLYIASAIISNSGFVTYYKKMHLHPGEDLYFNAGKKYHTLKVDGLCIANAICADTNQLAHSKANYALGAEVYIAGVLISESGYKNDTTLLKSYSEDFNLLVAVANYNSPTGAWLPIGKSAIWYNGELIVSANETQNALVIAEKQPSGWSGCVVNLE